MRSIRIIVAMLFLLLVAIAFVACGGGDDDDAGGNATASPTGGGRTQPATQPPGDTGGADTGGAGDGDSAAAEPCALLTRDEVAAALGEAIGEPDPTVVGQQQVSAGLTATVASCAYDSETAITSMSIDIWSLSGSDAAIRQFTAFVCKDKEEVSSIGDGGCWYSSDHNELQLSSGSDYLDLRATTSGDTSEVLQTLAEKVVSRLP